MDEFKTHSIKTRFGTFTIEYGECTTGPGYKPEYMVELKFNDTYLGHTIIVGDPRDMGSVMNETMIMDLELINIHCENVDDSIEHLGITDTPFKFDDELDRMEFMVKMLYKHPNLLKDSKWTLAEA